MGSIEKARNDKPKKNIICLVTQYFCGDHKHIFNIPTATIIFGLVASVLIG